MDASLDTCAIIDLYEANMQCILYNRFAKLVVYDFIRSVEMKHHASNDVIIAFDKDVKSGKIELITDEYLRSIGMYYVFKEHVKEWDAWFTNSDLGEKYAISLAQTLGFMCIITDDIKQRGPHYYLMRIVDTDVVPFTFYELLFLNFWEDRISESELTDNFYLICKSAGLTGSSWTVLKKLKNFTDRFWNKPQSERERQWMQKFCILNGINARERTKKLFKYCKENNT